MRQEFAAMLYDQKIRQKQRELGIDGLPEKLLDGKNVFDFPDGVVANGVCYRLIHQGWGEFGVTRVDNEKSSE